VSYNPAGKKCPGVIERRGSMFTRDYPCVAISIHGLVQQITVSYLRHGYYWYVSGTLPEGVEPEHVDETILAKYDIRKCWRYRARQKANGFANLQYIRCGRFYVIMATKGRHAFKVMEHGKLRDIRKSPLLVPIEAAPRVCSGKKRNRSRRSYFDGYAISYRRGRYQRKTAAEREAYRRAMEEWQRETLDGKRVPRPRRGERDPKWHANVAIEKGSFRRLQAYFNNGSVHWPRGKLEEEFSRVPYQAYWTVKQQLLLILGQVNRARKRASLEPLPYSVVLRMKRDQTHPFGQPESAAEKLQGV
jgi:hypothetical protein